MTEYSRMAKGNFTASASTGVVLLPFKPDYVQLFNYTNIAAAPAANKTLRAFWDASLIVSSNNPTMLEIVNNSTVTGFDVITNTSSNLGINAFSGGLSQQFGAAQQIIGITAANPAVVNVTAHGYSVGDTVILRGLFQSSTTGMPQINGIPFTISAVGDADHFTIKWNASGSNYTALSGSPTAAFVQKVLYPFLYAPQDNVISALTLASTTTVVTTMYHNFVVGQEVAFRIPSQWGTVQLNSLPNIITPGSPVYGFVTSVTDNWTFVVNINSSAYTAFNVNQPVSSVPGLTFPQVVPVGDINTGGTLISSGSPLYPSPEFPTSTSRVPTINGPAIRGSFVNNTSQGFTIGAGVGTNNSSTKIMAANDVIEWRAFYHDYSNP